MARTLETSLESPTHSTPKNAVAGDGEMGERIRAFNWETTPLKSIEKWPQSLKISVRLMIDSRYPMFIWWGKERINLYNDAYIPMLGKRHPWALGQPARNVWYEIWNILGPQSETILQEGKASWYDQKLLIMERNGYPEETYFTFSHSPIPDDAGGVGGIFCACTEDTHQVLNQRRLRTLRDLAESITAGSKTVESTCAAAAASLEKNSSDIPFALIYIFDRELTHLHLAGCVGIQEESPAAPKLVDLTNPLKNAKGWPFKSIATSKQAEIVTGLADYFGPLPGGPWPESPQSAMALPILQSDQENLSGVLIAGLSPRLSFNDDYRGFFELVSRHVGNNIANTRNYEEEKRRAEALAELDRAKTAFFSNVSHEFRTPLTLMLGPLEESLVDPALNEESRRRQKLIHRNSIRLLKLVNSLLDFSRIEAGRIQASFEPVDLCALTSDLVSMFRSAIEKAGLLLNVRCKPLCEPVYVDKEMWEKIVLNLLSNAFKHTFKGEIDVSLEMDDVIRMKIKDSGVGIPLDEIPRIFERFHRVQNVKSRAHEGTGIGLALVQELVRLHGGTVRVESEVGVGSTFTIQIPRGSAHLPPEKIKERPDENPLSTRATPFAQESLWWMPPDEKTGPSSRDPSAERTPSAVGRILLADDNADMRNYVQRLLKPHWHVEAVEDGRAALEAARARPPDLVLTDVMMAGLGGFELLRELRKDEKTKMIPVLMLSAQAGEEAKIEGLQSGAEDYLVKPFSARELLARVKTHLELAKLRNEFQRGKHRLYDLFMQAPVPICVLKGKDLVYEMANDLYFKLAQKNDILGKPLLEAFPQLKGQGFDDILRRVIETGESFAGKELPAKYYNAADGSSGETFLTFSCTPLRNASGAVEGLMAVTFDETAQVLARRKIEMINDDLERKVAERTAEMRASNEELEAFSYSVAHDLRAPLRSISSYSQLILRRNVDKLDPLSRDHFERIMNSGIQMSQLIDGLLNLSRLTREEIFSGTVDLSALAKGVAAELKKISPDRNVHIVITPNAKVQGDEDLLRTVLHNLLENAWKFTAKISTPRIKFGKKPGKEGPIYFVRDNGAGFDMTFTDTLFGAFHRLHHPSEFPGTGIGLATVQRIIHRHGGKIWAEGSVGKGATFYFTLNAPSTKKINGEEQ
jgi:signal transduction histidine kinase/FixJ family two-component response regulator